MTYRLDSQKSLFYKRLYILLVFSHVGIYLYMVDILDHRKSLTQKAFCLSSSFLLDLFYQFYFIYYMLHSLVMEVPFYQKRPILFHREVFMCDILQSVGRFFPTMVFGRLILLLVHGVTFLGAFIYAYIYSSLQHFELFCFCWPSLGLVVHMLYIYIYTGSRRVISHRKALYLICWLQHELFLAGFVISPY